MAGPRTRSQTFSHQHFPANFDTSTISKLKVGDLKLKITKLKSVYASSANKAELQATYVLTLMGVKKDDVKRVLETVSAWCEGKVAELHEEMEDKGLVVEGNRWGCIEKLVSHELGGDDSDEDDESEYEQKPPKKKAKVTVKTKVVAKAKGKGKGKEKEVVESEEEEEEEELPRKKTKVTTKTVVKGKGKTKETAVEEEEEEEEESKKKNGKAAAKTNGEGKGKEKEVLPELAESSIKRKAKGKGKKIAVGDSPAESSKPTKDKGKDKEIATEDPQEESSKSHKGKGKEIATEVDEPKNKVPAQAKYPGPEVLNLLIGSIFADLAKTETNLQQVYPGCPVDTKDEIVKYLNALPAFTTKEQVSQLIDNPKSETAKLVAWIADTFGEDIVLAEDDLKISGWPETTVQFVIARPRPHLQKLWQQAYTEDKEKSVLLFHGSAYVHLQSFLRRGFLASSDTSAGVGVFAAESPVMSNGYALTLSKGYAHSASGSVARALPVLYGGMWKNDPYISSRLLLGCEVTGGGRPMGGGEYAYHVVTRLHSVMARYILLLGSATAAVPTRATVGPAMTAAFETIRASIEEEDERMKKPLINLPSAPKEPGDSFRCPNYESLNLILSSVYWDINLNGKAPGSFPSQTTDEILAAFQHIPTFNWWDEIEGLVWNTANPGSAIVEWICSRYEGHAIFPATNQLRISAFHESIQQFVVVGHDPERQRYWERCFEIDKGKSMMLFHGTSLYNLQSILRNGFRASSDTTYGPGLFMGLEARTSYGYTGNRTGQGKKRWAGDVFGDLRLVIGCEVTDDGRPFVYDESEDEAVVVSRLRAIIPRYLFLIPGLAFRGGDYYYEIEGQEPVNLGKNFGLPSRHQVHDEMMNGFVQIREMIKERSV